MRRPESRGSKVERVESAVSHALPEEEIKPFRERSSYALEHLCQTNGQKEARQMNVNANLGRSEPWEWMT